MPGNTHGEQGGSLLKRALASSKTTSTVSTVSGRSGARQRAEGKTLSRSELGDSVLDDLLSAKRSRRGEDDAKVAEKLQDRRAVGDPERVVYVLGARPEARKSVPSAKKGCVKKLQKTKLCSKSRVYKPTRQVACYNHYKHSDCVGDDDDDVRWESTTDVGEFMPWEGRGTMSMGRS
jgi:hypothetical protein